MRSLMHLTWPETFGQRFKLALVINLLIVCVVTFFAALVFGPGFLPTIVVLTIVGLVMAVLTAAAARPGTNVWKPLFR
ncbi:MAG: hypothetical protein Q4G46_13135 [Propionibacteriaceae bacterium]|nr:hypothetical protein [Propionibacteriaceae bacterium]